MGRPGCRQHHGEPGRQYPRPPQGDAEQDEADALADEEQHGRGVDGWVGCYRVVECRDQGRIESAPGGGHYGQNGVGQAESERHQQRDPGRQSQPWRASAAGPSDGHGGRGHRQREDHRQPQGRLGGVRIRSGAGHRLGKIAAHLVRHHRDFDGQCQHRQWYEDRERAAPESPQVAGSPGRVAQTLWGGVRRGLVRGVNGDACFTGVLHDSSIGVDQMPTASGAG